MWSEDFEWILHFSVYHWIWKRNRSKRATDNNFPWNKEARTKNTSIWINSQSVFWSKLVYWLPSGKQITVLRCADCYFEITASIICSVRIQFLLSLDIFTYSMLNSRQAIILCFPSCISSTFTKFLAIIPVYQTVKVQKHSSKVKSLSHWNYRSPIPISI